MKKTKLLAVLSAAMLGCCAMGGTAFAEETEPVDYSKYQLGDITMDGVVDVEDAQFMCQVYVQCLVAYDPVEEGWVTEQQIALGNIDRQVKTATYNEVTCVFPIDLEEAMCVLQYYTDSISGKLDGKTLEEYTALYLSK